MSALAQEPMPDLPAGTAQLAYASARGGFGVQGTVGALTPDESNAIVGGINRDRREFGQDLPPFVSPADAARLHRNFTVQPTPAGLITWLTGPAGTDGSGRPGNVFTHALLERLPRPPHAPRPIDRWRSRSWLMPFGAADVDGARLPDPFGDDYPIVNRDRAIAFIRDPDAWRVGTLCALLDALTASGDAPVLVGVASPDDAAQWMGAISHLVGRPYAERLGFSLWEAENSLATRKVRTKLVFVPEHQLGAPWATSFAPFVVRTSEEPPPREWAASATPMVAPSPFGPLAAALFSFFDEPAAVLAEMDLIADRVRDDADQPGWPLAMALARHVEAWPELAGPVADALLREAPSRIDEHPDLWDLSVRVVNGQAGGTADDVWRTLQAYVGIPIPMRDVLRKIHLGLRLEHPADLIAVPAPPPVLGAGRWSAWTDPDILALAEQGVRTARAVDPLRGAVLALRIADAISGETMPGSSAPAMTQTLCEAVTDLVLPWVVSGDPRALVRAAGPLHGASLNAVVRPALAGAPIVAAGPNAAPGPRLAADVVSWLYPVPLPVSASAEATELDVEAALAYARLGLTSPWWRWTRFATLRYAVSARPSRPVAALVQAAVPRDNLTVREARNLLAAGPGRLPLDHALGAVAMMGLPDRAEASLLVREVGSGGTGAVLHPDERDLLHRLGLVLTQPQVRPGSSIVDLQQQAVVVLQTAGQLTYRSRVSLGAFWTTTLSTWVAMARGDAVAQWGRQFAAVLPADDEMAAADLIAAFQAVREPDRWHVLAVCAALAVQLDEGWPLQPTLPAEVLTRLHRPGSPPAVELAAQRIYAGLDRRELQLCRDEVVKELEAGERLERDARRAAQEWFERVGGATGLGSVFRRGKGEGEA